MADLQTFLESPPGDDLEQAVQEIVLGAERLDQEQAQAVLEAARRVLPEDNPYGAGFDMAGELGDMITAVRSMRRKVLDESGQVRSGVQIKDLQAFLSASSTLMTTLIRHHEKILSFDRQRAIENTTISLVAELSTEWSAWFMSALEVELEKIR